MSEFFPFSKESVNIEYKAKYTYQIGNTICAFLNTVGGHIYIGLGEKDDSEKKRLEIIEKIQDLLNRFKPNPTDKITFGSSAFLGNVIIDVSIAPPTDTKVYYYNNIIYYRVGKNNRICSSTELIEDVFSHNRRKANALPILEEYSPSEIDKGIAFDNEKKNHKVSYKRIGPHPQYRSNFYKYLDLETVMMIFREDPNKHTFKQTMRFVEPPKWDDQFESRFYNANYKKVNKDPNNIPKLYATCFTPKEESEPAWMAYNKEKDGLGKRCVQFLINQIKLREELVKNLKNSSNCTIVEGSVNYESKETIRTLHLSTDKDDKHREKYDKYFSDFTLANYINLLLLKRIAYEHEREVRIFLIYDEDKLRKKAKNKDKYDYKDIQLDWLTILERIRVSPDCTQTEIDLLQDEINNMIDKSGKPDLDGLKKKLEVKKYNVNEDEDRGKPLPIGETYKHFQKRMEAKKNKGKS